jgi:long-chain-fatty-acid--CoA ligase ACSBG
MRPGNCCTLIYTSGTTGMPKGVMLSHDNFIWTSKSALEVEPASNRPLRVISYLPLSHAAAQFIDIFRAFMTGSHIFFADPSALQGSLIQTLQEVKPEGFFSVPRVWEKIYSKMMEMSKSNTGILAKIGTVRFIQPLGQRALAKKAPFRKQEARRRASNSNSPKDLCTIMSRKP